MERRKHFFFWLGVFVLPLFWSWFTLHRSFTHRQRYIAFSWLAVSVLMMICSRSVLVEHWELNKVGYPIFFAWLNISLLVWLCFRMGLVPGSLIEAVFTFYMLAYLSSHFQLWTSLFISRPFTWNWLISPFTLVLAHYILMKFEQLKQPNKVPCVPEIKN
jgi:hypothetical protein